LGPWLNENNFTDGKPYMEDFITFEKCLMTVLAFFFEKDDEF